MPVVRSAPRQLVVLHPAPYALPAVSSLEFDMPHPLEPNPSFSSTEAGPSTLASSPQFSPKRIRKAAKRVAKEEGKQLVEQGELRMTVMGQGGPGEVSAAKSVKGAQDWNRLLCWARKRRGPQWDACTQMYHVDYLSPEYYNPPAPLKAPPRAATRAQAMAELAVPQNPAVIQHTTSANRPTRRKAREH